MQSKSNSLQCGVCYEFYDLKNHLPRILSRCGHTLCTSCIHKIFEIHPGVKCPFDNIFHNEQRRAEDFKINFSLKALIDESSVSIACPDHRKELEYVCFTDQKKLCRDCIIFGGHRDQNQHNVKALTDLKGSMEEKKKKLEYDLAMLDTRLYEIQNILNDEKTKTKFKLKMRVHECLSIVSAQEKKLQQKLDEFFHANLGYLNASVGKDSLYQLRISNKINSFSNFTTYPNIFELIEDDHERIDKMTGQLQMDHTLKILKDEAEDLSKQIEKSIQSFQKSIVMSLKTNFDFQLPKTIGFIYPQAYLIEDLKKGWNPTVKPTRLELKVNDDFLEVRMSDEIYTQLFEKVNEWKDLNKVRVFVEETFCIDVYELSVFDLIPKIMTNLHKIEILKGSNTKSLYLKSISEVFSSLLICPSLQSLKIALNETNYNNELLITLAEKALPQMTDLKDVLIDLSYTSITDKGLGVFVEAIKPLTQHLKSFNLSLGGTCVSEKKIQGLFQQFPNVEKFYLGLEGLYFTEESIKKFLEVTLPSMRLSKSLILNLINARVCSSSLNNLICSVKQKQGAVIFLGKEGLIN